MHDHRPAVCLSVSALARPPFSRVHAKTYFQLLGHRSTVAGRSGRGRFTSPVSPALSTVGIATAMRDWGRAGSMLFQPQRRLRLPMVDGEVVHFLRSALSRMPGSCEAWCGQALLRCFGLRRAITVDSHRVHRTSVSVFALTQSWFVAAPPQANRALRKASLVVRQSLPADSHRGVVSSATGGSRARRGQIVASTPDRLVVNGAMRTAALNWVRHCHLVPYIAVDVCYLS